MLLFPPRARLSSFEKEGEEGEHRKGKLDLNMHVLTALSCGPCGSWSTCSYRAGSGTGVRQSCAGGDKAAFVPPACLLRSRMTRGPVRCSV